MKAVAVAVTVADAVAVAVAIAVAVAVAVAVGQNANQHILRRTDGRPGRSLGVARLVAPTWQVGATKKGKHKQ